MRKPAFPSLVGKAVSRLLVGTVAAILGAVFILLFLMQVLLLNDSPDDQFDRNAAEEAMPDRDQ
jgi:hypothetical protein